MLKNEWPALAKTAWPMPESAIEYASEGWRLLGVLPSDEGVAECVLLWRNSPRLATKLAGNEIFEYFLPVKAPFNQRGFYKGTYADFEEKWANVDFKYGDDCYEKPLGGYAIKLGNAVYRMTEGDVDALCAVVDHFLGELLGSGSEFGKNSTVSRL